jgi:DNA polymerase III epsilon subunit-like protein
MSEPFEERLTFTFRGSADYAMEVIRRDGDVSLRCTCPAFVRPSPVHYLACKHVLGLLRGSGEKLVEPAPLDLERLDDWIRESTFSEALDKLHLGTSPEAVAIDELRAELRRTHKAKGSAPNVRPARLRGQSQEGAVPTDTSDVTPPVFIDIETTGFYPDYGDRVIEIAILAEDGSVLLESLVDPEGKRSTHGALGKHRIPDAELVGKPCLHDLAPRIAELVKGKTVVGWNVTFEQDFLGEILDEAADVVDAMARFAINGDRMKLEDAADQIGHQWDGPQHRARPDAATCGAIWRWLDERGVPRRPEAAKAKGSVRGGLQEKRLADIERRLSLLEEVLAENSTLRTRVEELERALQDRHGETR